MNKCSKFFVSLIVLLIFAISAININLKNQVNDPNINSTHNNGIKMNNGSLIIQSNNTKLVLDLNTKGTIISIENLITSQNFNFDPDSYTSFWSIELMDSSRWDSLSSSSFIYNIVSSAKVTLEYELPLVQGPMYVLITIQVDTPHPGINMNINVIANENHTGISWVNLPHISAIKGWSITSNQEEIAVPDREGWLIKDAISSILDYGFYREYPGTLSMQFLIFVEPNIGGFMLSSLDSNSRHKYFMITGDNWGKETIQIEISHSSNNMRFEKANNFTMDYWVVFESYQGRTWAEAANLYREWATKQWYVEKGSVYQRDDVPQWLKIIDYIWKSSSYATDYAGNVILEGHTVDEMGQFPLEFKNKGLSSNFLLEWWGWQKEGHDRGYPEYYPPRDGDLALSQGINDVHNEQSKVMLYFNGRLVDITTATYSNNTQYMTGYYDSIYTESYSPYFTAAIPDPSSQWWQEVVLNFSFRAVRDFNADVVFLDQISVAPPKFDYRNISTHTPGGGSWWQEAENKLLSNIRLKLSLHNPQVALSSENIIETYLNPLDLFWNYQTSYDLSYSGWFPHGISIPLFSYIYHKFTLFSGRADVHPGNFHYYVWSISEDLERGYIPGGTGGLPSVENYDPNPYSFLLNAYTTRKIGNYSFFRDGDLLLPIEWDDSPTKTISEGYKSMIVNQGSIQGFRNPDNEILLLFANRGYSDLTWVGKLGNLLALSGVNNLKNHKASIMIFNNGRVDKSMDSRLDSKLEINVPKYSFVAIWFKNFEEIIPIPVNFTLIFLFTLFAFLGLAFIISIVFLRRKTR
ncbi:MAG: DUF6259 domain-containing protein [Candidatus Hermodarchaeota archaeon]